MNAWTPFRFLVGDRESILHIAGSRHALWVGALFVLSAALARDYDGSDLLREPWHLAIPFGASLASSFTLFSIAYVVAAIKGGSLWPFFPRYLSFLGLFWMTAPLAWLYAVPYERFLPEYHAAAVNLLTLGVVSAWRVALMVRVLSVLFGFSFWGSLSLVMVVANTLALILISSLPFPLMALMGGLHLTESQELVRVVSINVGVLAFVFLPLWLIFVLVALVQPRRSWGAGESLRRGPTLGLSALAVASVLVWGGVLPFTQPEQQRRHEVERAFDKGDLDQAFALMARHPEQDFPRHWQPPGPSEKPANPARPNAEWITFTERLGGADVVPWVRSRYAGRVRSLLSEVLMYRNKGEVARLVTALEQTSEGRALLAELDDRSHKTIREEFFLSGPKEQK
jgi:hypothetical protein